MNEEISNKITMKGSNIYAEEEIPKIIRRGWVKTETGTYYLEIRNTRMTCLYTCAECEAEGNELCQLCFEVDKHFDKYLDWNTAIFKKKTNKHYGT